MPKARADDWQILDSPGPLKTNTLFSVEGRTAVVTGGGSGIGSMIAAGYVANGANVVIVSRKDCSDLATTLTQRGPGTCVALQADVAKDEDLESLKRSLEERCKQGIHVLFNNAGTNWAQPIDKHSLKGWDKVYAVNVRGVFAVTQALLSLLDLGAKHSQRRSVVINIGSIESIFTPAHPTYSYSSGKAAVGHLTRVLAGSFGTAGRPINVNCIHPGPFVSRMMRATIASIGEKTIGSTTAVGRIGSPEDMAGAALFLGSRAGEYVNGAQLVVDGGTVVMPHMGTHPSPGSKL